MRYLVTGGTGFLGRFLVERLLERGGEVHVLVREASRARLMELAEGWGAPDRVVPLVGDIAEPDLGLTAEQLDGLRGTVDHLFHLAAVYDMTADDARNELLNAGGTRHVVQVAKDLQVGHLHHVSSVAVAGDYDGYFREDMFDEGQRLPSPYHRTKFEAERIVRVRATVPWRVYRPAVVVGHSRTGEMDKIDGPYYFFKAIQKLRAVLPPWVPLAGPELGWTNLVPVDYVVAAMDALAHADGLDGQAFHLTAPRSIRSGEVLNAFAEAAHAPKLAMRIDKGLLDALPKGTLSMLLKLPALKEIRKQLLADLGIPEEVLAHIALKPRFDTRDTERGLAGTGIEVPALPTYAAVLWDYWERHLDPDLHRDRTLAGAVRGKTVIVTGASSGIGRAAALKLAQAGAHVLLVSRGREKLQELADEVSDGGGQATVHPTDLTDLQDIDRLVQEVLAQHGHVDVLVNNAGRSIRRSVKLSYDRFHDYERTMQLNYFGAIRLIMGLLPSMTSRRTGHVVNVSSIGVQTSPPRFSAYVASKAALDAFTRIAATEVLSRGVTFTTIHMPLVRTPMIAPTKLYDSFPTITPEEAADLVCDAVLKKPKQINTRLGTFGEVAYALAPKAVDQVLNLAYKTFPDSTAAKKKDPSELGSAEDDAGTQAELSGEAVALAHLMRGVHW